VRCQPRPPIGQNWPRTATGGHLLIGIEDGQEQPPAGQRVPAELPDTLRRKLAERTVNVAALPNVVTANNGGQYIDLTIPRATAVASTTDGRYFLRVADQTYQLTQRERIALGLLAQHDALTTRELAKALELPSVESLLPWLKRPLEWQLVRSTGRTQATRYFIDPQLLRSLDFSTSTTLKRIEPHRLLALIVEDVGRYPLAKISEIHQRIGAEIPRSRIRRSLEQLVREGTLHQEGVRSGTRYRLP
jgi:hypothetical protein